MGRHRPGGASRPAASRVRFTSTRRATLLLAADALVEVLSRVHRDPRHREPFRATLPVAGRDGTLSERLRGTAAEGTARAKTGSMSQVRTLAGYVETRDGEQLAFAVVANNFHVAPTDVTRVIDEVVVALASFSRR